jgi:hypothetical protein
MKKVSLLAVFIVCVSLIAFTTRPAEAEITMHVVDFPQYGITIITPQNTLFNSLLNTWLQGAPPPSWLQTVRPYSIFVRNTTNRKVAGLAVRWQITYSNGKVFNYSAQSIILRGLMDRGAGTGQADTTELIDAGQASYQILPPVHIPPIGGQSPLQGTMEGDFYAGNDQNHGQVDDAARTDNDTAIRDFLVAKLQNATDITVVIEGVFFDNGTYIGVNSTQFFEKIRAQRDGNNDLLRKIATMLSQNYTYTQIYDYLQALANSPYVPNGQVPTATPADVFDFAKQDLARQILTSRTALGDSGALDNALAPLRITWPALTKLQ